MDISFTKNQLKTLIQLIHFGGYFAHGYSKESIKEFDDLEQYLFSQINEAGLDSMVHNEAGLDSMVHKDILSGVFFPGHELHELFKNYYDKFIEEVFWQHLIQKLSDRDYKEKGLDEKSSSFDEGFDKLSPIIQHYMEEFEANGVKNLYLKEKES